MSYLKFQCYFKGKKSGGSQLIPAVQPIVELELNPQSINLDVNPTVSPSNHNELNPIVVTATAVQHETEHLLNQDCFYIILRNL